VYAIIRSGGRQVRVVPGETVTVDHISMEPGEEVSISEVLFVLQDDGEILAGSPTVANARVVGVVDGIERGPKIRVFKKKRRKGVRRTMGHRTTFTRVRIKEIVL